MPSNDDLIIDRTPEEVPSLGGEDLGLGDEAQEEAQEQGGDLGDVYDRGKEAYEKYKDIRDKNKQEKPEKPEGVKEQPDTGKEAKGEKPDAKAGKPEPEGPGTKGPKPSDVKGEIGKPIAPKGAPTPGAGAGAAGDVGGLGTGAAGGTAGGTAGTAGGAGAAAGGTAAGTAGAAEGAAAGGAAAAGTAGAAEGAAAGGAAAGGTAAGGWIVVLIIIAILLIVAIILFIIGFVVGMSAGGKGDCSSAYKSAAGQVYISTDGKYFPLNKKPDDDFRGAARYFGAPRDSGARRHAGVDLITRAGTPVRAVANGKIVNFYPFLTCIGGQSYALLVDHGDFVINYGEVSANLANRLGVGSRVTAGQVIAYTNGCGMLHFELYAPGTTQNSPWWPNRGKPSNLWNPTDLISGLLQGFK